MSVKFEVVAVGGGNRKRHDTMRDAIADVKTRLQSKATKPYEYRVLGKEDFVEANLTDLAKEIRATLRLDPGNGVVVRGSDRDELRFKVVKLWVETKGSLVVRAALSQQGVEYKFAWADPTGDENGSSGFDCSGLTMWAYSQVGVLLPHSASAQWTSGAVIRFHDANLLKPGDLAFYDATDRANPDHCGIYAGMDGTQRKVIDASTYWDAVVRRDLDANPIYGFGRIAAVNGPLAA